MADHVSLRRFPQANSCCYIRVLAAHRHRHCSIHCSLAALPVPPGRAELVQHKVTVIADLRTDRDHWRTVAERLSLPKPEPAEQPPTTPWQRFLRWRRATG
jgi:hypothetical protein